MHKDNYRMIDQVVQINLAVEAYREVFQFAKESVATSEYVRIYSVDGGRIMVSDNVSSYDIYDMQGVRLNANNAMQQGVYLVKYETKSGNAGVKKLYVK